jgi:hypothetical protein
MPVWIEAFDPDTIHNPQSFSRRVAPSTRWTLGPPNP